MISLSLSIWGQQICKWDHRFQGAHSRWANTSKMGERERLQVVWFGHPSYPPYMQRHVPNLASLKEHSKFWSSNISFSSQMIFNQLPYIPSASDEEFKSSSDGTKSPAAAPQTFFSTWVLTCNFGTCWNSNFTFSPPWMHTVGAWLQWL